QVLTDELLRFFFQMVGSQASQLALAAPGRVPVAQANLAVRLDAKQLRRILFSHSRDDNSPFDLPRGTMKPWSLNSTRLRCACSARWWKRKPPRRTITRSR